MKTLEKGMYLLPDDQFEFELKKHPLTKQEIQGENKSLMTIVTPEILENSKFMQKLNREKTHTLIRSEVYFDKFYTPEEFDKKNAEDVAKVIQGILRKLGAKKADYKFVKSNEAKDFSEAKRDINAKGGYKVFEGKGQYASSEKQSTEASNKEEIKKTITFEGIASSKEELNEYIKEKNIDIENLDGWLQELVESHGDKNRTKHYKGEKYTLSYNKDTAEKITQISANIKISPMFKASLGAKFSHSSAEESTYHEEIIFDIEFGEE